MKQFSLLNGRVIIGDDKERNCVRIATGDLFNYNETKDTNIHNHFRICNSSGNSGALVVSSEFETHLVNQGFYGLNLNLLGLSRLCVDYMHFLIVFMCIIMQNSLCVCHVLCLIIIKTRQIERIWKFWFIRINLWF